MNLTIIRGTVRDEPTESTLPTGGLATTFDVVVAGPERDLVPVTSYAPCSARAGDVVVVVGRTRKRFWRVGDRTRARTDVVASAVVPARQAKRAERAVRQALAEAASLGSAAPRE